MCSDIVLKVDSVSKHYEIFESQKDKLRKLISDFLGKQSTKHLKKHIALEDINFQAKRGEVIGVLGRNGAGKSTLLQLICGTLTPTSGTIEVNGRLAALLELGAGFNPDFTGKENIFINSAILGLSREEINDRLNSIIDFADVGDFINQPVKNYSSGMFMRLAFAVASSVEPDILIIDEALAVGDAKFQAKCFRRLDELRNNGTTILLVTHSTEQITRHCSKALLINESKLLAFGDAKSVSNQYLELLFGKKKADLSENDSFRETKSCQNEKFENSIYYSPDEHRWGNGEAEILSFQIQQGEKINPVLLRAESEYIMSFRVSFKSEVENAILGLTIKTSDGLTVFGRNTLGEKCDSHLKKTIPGSVVTATFKIKPLLCTGDYLISIGVAKNVNDEIVPMERRYDSLLIRVESDSASYGIVDLNNEVEVHNG